MNSHRPVRLKTASESSQAGHQADFHKRRTVTKDMVALQNRLIPSNKQNLSDMTKPLLQAKLRIGRPNDKYEEEADRVAQRVIDMPESKVRRQTGEEEEEEEQLVQMADQISPRVLRQTLLEKEEEELQPEVLSGREALLIQRQMDEEEEEEEEIQSKSNSGTSSPWFQRQVEEEEEEEEVQTKAKTARSTETTPALFGGREVRLGKGRPLPKPTRSFFESRFGYDFRQVRIHTDARATDSARALNAKAFTLGHNIAFGQGQYDPQTTNGKRLIAHELTHVIQQGRGGPKCSENSAHFEGDADRGRKAIPAEQKSVTVNQSSKPGLALDSVGESLNVALTPEDLWRQAVQSFRGFASSSPGAPPYDPKGVGTALGKGYETFAAIQIIDGEGKQVVVGVGAYLGAGQEHGEIQAIKALRKQVPANVSGGCMMVVVEQKPCPACAAALDKFARELRLAEMEVYVPERKAVRGTRMVKPKTAATTSFKGNVPELKLERIVHKRFPAGTPPAVPTPKVEKIEKPAKSTTVKKPLRGTTSGIREQPSKSSAKMKPTPRVTLTEGGRIKISSGGAWRTAGKIGTAGGGALSVWGALNSIDTSAARMQKALTGSVHPEVARAMKAVEKEFPHPKSFWTERFSTWNEDKESDKAAKWLHNNGVRALMAKGDLLSKMGDHLNTLYWYISKLDDLEYEYRELRDRVAPIHEEARKRRMVLHEIAEETLKYIPYMPSDTAQVQLWDVYITFYDAGRDMGQLESLLSRKHWEYSQWYKDSRSKRLDATKVFNFWAPAFERVWGKKTLATQLPEE